MEKDCYNCRYYIYFCSGSQNVEVCCKHRVRVVAEENVVCYGWELDDLHDNDAMDSCKQEDHLIVPYKE